MDVVQRRISSQRLLAFLPQNVTFHPASTPEGILEFYGRLRGTDKGRRNRLLAEFDLESAATRPICKLSGGMLQRLGLVLALLPDAPALILDEPGASLDPEWRIVLREELLNEARRGKTILLTSHLPEEWSDATDTWFDCREGRIFSSEPREAA
jgi:ABC-type multidrug transport system ATPase subunit